MFVGILLLDKKSILISIYIPGGLTHQLKKRSGDRQNMVISWMPRDRQNMVISWMIRASLFC